MDKAQDLPKTCCCARCMMPIDDGDMVVIEGETFHKRCSMCCVCGKIPTSLKPFWGQVFCPECFQKHVLNKFPGDGPHGMFNSWWMSWALGMSEAGVAAKENKKKEAPKQEEEPKESSSTDNDEKEKEKKHPKKCCCARCQKAIESGMVEIGGQCFHKKCAQCCCCHCAANASMKYHKGLVFCEKCYRTMMEMNPKADNLSAFYGMCFELWKSPTIAAQMQEFMSSRPHDAPVVTVQQPEGFSRCEREAPVGACS